MTENNQGVLAEGAQLCPLEQGQSGGDEPARTSLPGERAAAEIENSTTLADLPESSSEAGPQSGAQNGLQFMLIPRPSERRAQEFLPQWLRRLGRG